MYNTHIDGIFRSCGWTFIYAQHYILSTSHGCLHACTLYSEGMYVTCISLYCSFILLPANGHMAQCRVLGCYATGHGFDPMLVIKFFISFYFSFFYIIFTVLLLLIQFNVNFCDYLYIMTVWNLLFRCESQGQKVTSVPTKCSSMWTENNAESIHLCIIIIAVLI